ncbi:MAG: adenosine deaminase family protein [Deltaproteobacteria bacterium]|nr:adenosine deaminase family protein [Deltaproteobacteria bacterium]
MKRIKLDRPQIKLLPKTDLHVHLDGSVPPMTLQELAVEQKIDLVEVSKKLGIGGLKSGDMNELEAKIFKKQYNSLAEYLVPFEFINVVLRSEEGLKKAAYKLAFDNFREGVRYFECRFAPQKHWVNGFDWLEIVSAVNAGLKQAADEFNNNKEIKAGKEPEFKYAIILCAMRMINQNMGDYYRYLYELHVGLDLQNLAAMASLEVAKLVELCQENGLPVSGFDLAGREDGFPAEVHKTAFLFCYERGISTTCHAGEAYGPESIRSAIKHCHVRRIGHGTQLFNEKGLLNKKGENGKPLNHQERKAYVTDIAEWIADNRIALEVCLKSNSQTLPDLRDLSNHPFPSFLKHQIRIALGTDNRAISRVSVTDEYERVMNLYNIDHKQLRDLCVGGFKAAFYPGPYTEKRAYISRVITYYKKLAGEMGLF